MFVAVVTASVMFLLLRHSPCAKIPGNLLTTGDAAGNAVGSPSRLDLGDAAQTPFEYGAEDGNAIREKFFRRLYCPEGEYLYFPPDTL